MSEPIGKCPSGDASAADALVFAIAGKSADEPLLRYLDKPVPVSLVRQAGANPQDIENRMRISSDCMGGRCRNFDQGRSSCRLATELREFVPVVVEKLPPCAIRKDCVWWKQEGILACQRCPTITHQRA